MTLPVGLEVSKMEEKQTDSSARGCIQQSNYLQQHILNPPDGFAWPIVVPLTVTWTPK